MSHLKVGDRCIINKAAYFNSGGTGTIINVILRNNNPYQYIVKLDNLSINKTYAISKVDPYLGANTSPAPLAQVGTKYKVGEICQDRYGTKVKILATDQPTYKYEIVSCKNMPESVGQIQYANIENFDKLTVLASEEIEGYEYKIEYIGVDMSKNNVSPQQVLTFKDAFVHEFEKTKPKYEGQAGLWYKQGLCPKCGEKGRYHLSTPCCSKHGAY